MEHSKKEYLPCEGRVLFPQSPVRDRAGTQIPECRSRNRIARPEKVAPPLQHQHLRAASCANRPQRNYLCGSPATDDKAANALRYRAHRERSPAVDPVRLQKSGGGGAGSASSDSSETGASAPDSPVEPVPRQMAMAWEDVRGIPNLADVFRALPAQLYRAFQHRYAQVPEAQTPGTSPSPRNGRRTRAPQTRRVPPAS